MAAIYKRINRDGSTRWRVSFRRKGLPSFSTCFSTQEQAEKFSHKYEPIYTLDHENFQIDKLRLRREREFNVG